MRAIGLKQVIIGVGVVLALCAVALSVYAIVVTPARQPYRDALAQYKNVYNANVNVIVAGSSLNASSATDEQFEKATRTVEASLVSLKTENEALGKKDVLQDGEGKQLYDTFTDKLTAYATYNTDMLASMRKVRPVIYGCSQQMSQVAENETGVEAMRSCADQLGKLATVPDADYQALVIISKALYAQFADNLGARAKLSNPKGKDAAKYTELSNAQETILENLNKASSTFSSNVQKHKQAVDITDSAMVLDEYLRRKSSIFRG